MKNILHENIKKSLIVKSENVTQRNAEEYPLDDCMGVHLGNKITLLFLHNHSTLKLYSTYYKMYRKIYLLILKIYFEKIFLPKVDFLLDFCHFYI